MFRALAMACVLVLVGCSSTAVPNLIGGKYYMAGDANCAFTQAYQTHIVCLNRQKKVTGTRAPMTAQEIQMWQFQQMQQQAANQAMLAQINANNQAMNAATAARYQHATCMNNGYYTSCRSY